MLTDKQRKALRILRDHPNIPAKAFAGFYFDTPEHQYLFTASSKSGNSGNCRGKKAWLCAGSLLGKLCRQGLVRCCVTGPVNTFSLTVQGLSELSKPEVQTLPDIVKVSSNLDGKWHREKNDLPKPYTDIVVETRDGLFIDGFRTKEGRFCPHDRSKVEGLKEVRWRRWRYGLLDDRRVTQ